MRGLHLEISSLAMSHVAPERLGDSKLETVPQPELRYIPIPVYGVACADLEVQSRYPGDIWMIFF